MKIREKREEKNLTQMGLASQLGVNQNTVSQWETGERLPRASMLIKIADALGCTVDELLKEE